MANKKNEKGGTILYRSETNKILGGVCGGLGEVFNIDPTIVRVLFAVATFFGGSGILLYIVLWIVIPRESKVSNSSEVNIRENIEELKDRAQNFSKEFHIKNKNPHMLFGVILLILGIMFLLGNFGLGHWFNFEKLWPLFLIAFGLLILRGKSH